MVARDPSPALASRPAGRRLPYGETVAATTGAFLARIVAAATLEARP
jgi:hypothetical protein